MSQVNSTRNGCKDVFHAFLVENATYAGDLEIPRIAPEDSLPMELIRFSKAVSMKEGNPNAWVHFYEDDAAFERMWNDPRKYLPILKRFRGVITPDFSLYRDMPLVMQYWNIYRSRAIGHWIQENEIPVIVNVRYGDERTYATSCLGVPGSCAIAVGSHGCLKLLRDRELFINGLDYTVGQLHPKAIVVYGASPESVFGKYKTAGIQVLQFDSDFAIAHRKGDNP